MNANSTNISTDRSTFTLDPGGSVASPAHQKAYGGIGRRGFCLVMAGILAFDAAVSASTEADPAIGLILIFLTFALSLFVTAKRLRNIGMSEWYALLGLVPIVSTILGVRCLMMPEGYQDTRKLDAPAKVILGSILFLSCAALLAVAAAT